MAFNYFSFNGRSLEDLGFIIKKKPEYMVAEKDYSSEEIPGKNGNVIAYHNRFKNRSSTYTIMSLPTRVRCSNRDLVTKLNLWLSSPEGYCRFTDSFNKGLYTEAFCSKISNVQDHMDGVIEAEVTFDVKPFWYIDNDIEVINATNGKEYILQNPTGYISYPRIVVRTSLSQHELAFTFTDSKNNVKSFSVPYGRAFAYQSNEVVYDSETGDVLIDDTPYNEYISNFDYPPHFSTGENKVMISQYHERTISYVAIEPRWRIL